MRTWVGLVAVIAACGNNLGHQSLIRVDPEPPGPNCPNGGVAIQSGLDTNDDSILENTEITSTQYVCNATTSVSCPQGGMSVQGPITIASAADFAQLAGVGCIQGDLLITGLTDAAFPPLPDLKVVTGSVVVAANSALASLDGIALEHFGTSYLVQGNPALANVDALGSLVAPFGTIEIVSDDLLTDLAGLAPLDKLTGLVVSGNASLTSLHGLERATKIGNLTVHSNPVLGSFAALAALGSTTVMEVSSNPALTTIGLPALATVTTRLLINANAGLVSVDLPALATVGDLLQLDDDPTLTTITAPALLLAGNVFLQASPAVTTASFPKLSFVTVDLDIIDLPALVTPELAALETVGHSLNVAQTGVTSFAGFGALRYVSGDMQIVTNAALTSFSGLTSIQQVGGNLKIVGNAALPLATAQAFATSISVGGTVTIQ